MANDLPLSVWPNVHHRRTGLHATTPTNKASRETSAYAGEVARRAIATYSDPGDLVLDLACGSADVVTTAIRLGRNAIAIEPDERRARAAIAKVALAQGNGATGRAEILVGEAWQARRLVGESGAGAVTLVLHDLSGVGPIETCDRDKGGRRCARHTNGRMVDVCATSNVLTDTFSEFQFILLGCAEILRPGGVLFVIASPIFFGDHLNDLPGALGQMGGECGIDLFERNVVLDGHFTDDTFVPRSCATRRRTHRIDSGPPLRRNHHDLLVFRKRP